MLINIVDMLIGAVSGGGVAFAVGRRQGRRSKTSATPAAVCEGCKHGLSFHADNGNGRCHGSHREMVYRNGLFDSHKLVACACQHYVGPIPVDRIISSFQLPQANPTDES